MRPWEYDWIFLHEVNERHLELFVYTPWGSIEFDCGYRWFDWVEYCFKQGWRLVFCHPSGRALYWGKGRLCQNHVMQIGGAQSADS